MRPERLDTGDAASAKLVRPLTGAWSTPTGSFALSVSALGLGLTVGIILAILGMPYEYIVFYFVLLAVWGSASATILRIKNFPSAIGAIAIGVAWVALVNVDVFVLGRGARLEWGDGNELFWTYFPYLASQRGSSFLHLLAGGVDPLSVGRVGGEFFSWRVWLAGQLPLWAVAVFLRFFVSLVAFFGVYRLLRDVVRTDRLVAVSCAMLYSVAYDVTSAMTFLYGLSLAAFPLLFWALWRVRPTMQWAVGLIVLAVVYATGSDPLYWLPTLWFVACALLIVVRPVHAGACLAGLLFISAVWVLNFSETIFSIVQFVPFSARAQFGGALTPFLDRLIANLRWCFTPSVGFNQGGWPMVSALALLAAASVANGWRPRFAFFLLLALCAATPILRSLPYPAMGLGFLETYSWYVEYGAFSFAAIGLGLALKHLTAASNKPHIALLRSSLLCGFVIGLAFAMSSIIRVSTYLDMFHRGSIARASEIPNLVQADWYAGPLWRAISVGEQPFANTPSNHGIATYDGTSTFFSQRLHRYWEDGILKGAERLRSLEVQISQDWEYWTLAAPRTLADRVDLDFLRIANVRYVLSAAPLADASLRKISGPTSDNVFDTRPSKRERTWILSAKWRDWLRNPPPVYVYEIDGALARAFVAKTVECANDDLTEESFQRVRAVAIAGGALVRCADAEKAGGDTRAVQAIRLLPDGFEIDLSPSLSGTTAALVVNTPFVPFWKASADGTALAVYPANIAQFAVAVPASAATVKIVYRAKRLFANAP